MMNVKSLLLVAALLLAGLILAGCSSGAGVRPEQPAARAEAKPGEKPAAKVGAGVGDLAPDFRLTRMDGSVVSLADLRGQPAVLVFWTAWCPNCKEEAPRVNELAAKYEPRGVRVLGINIMDSEARAAGGVKEFGIRYAVARDPDASVARRYKVSGTPTVVVLDRGGVVRYVGHELPKDYVAQFEALLAERG